MATDCDSLVGRFPWPPANATAMSAFHSSDTDIRWDDPSELNAGSEVVGEATSTAFVKVVVNGTPTVEASATASLMIISAPVTAGSTVEVDSVVITCVHGTPAADEFDGSSVDPEVVAESLLTAINEGSVGTWQIATATRNLSSLSLEAVISGVTGNDISLASTATEIVPSGSTFSGGTELSALTIAQYSITGVDGDRTAGGMDFDINDAGASLADAINDPENLLSYVTATWGGTCLLIEAAVDGKQGNGIEVSSNSDALFVTHTATYGGSGTPCPPGKDNSRWNVLGVNIYRSDTGERGPYFRVNQVPVGTQFYRDRTDVVEVPAELIPWDGGWIFKGDSPNNKGWRLKTRYTPVVKRLEDSRSILVSNAVHADSPFDVEVYIDGERVVVNAVFGKTGEVDLSHEQVWDPSTETFQDPPIPTETSVVQVRYRYLRTNKLVNTIDRRYKVFYRLTTVVQDPTGTSPTGLVETPLGFSEPISPMNSEKIDYMWREAIKRNRWILEQGGERVKLFIRRVNGNPCQCVWDPRLEEVSKQPLNNCLTCYGTRWVGGYEGPYDLIIGPDESERRVTQTPNGRRLESTYEVWIGPSPMVSQRDFIVKQNGERYSIGPVTRTHIRGVVLQQSFQVGYLSSTDIRYRVPMVATERLPWPETRFTRPEDAPCVESDPYPIGCDPQATPMMSEKESIPDGREERGRTPVYQNLTYGGKGGR